MQSSIALRPSSASSSSDFYEVEHYLETWELTNEYELEDKETIESTLWKKVIWEPKDYIWYNFDTNVEWTLYSWIVTDPERLVLKLYYRKIVEEIPELSAPPEEPEEEIIPKTWFDKNMLLESIRKLNHYKIRFVCR